MAFNKQEYVLWLQSNVLLDVYNMVKMIQSVRSRDTRPPWKRSAIEGGKIRFLQVLDFN
jgi:hypothetical protein